MREFFSTLFSAIHAFNWHTPSWDLFIVLLWLAGGALYAFTAGRGRLVTILLSAYVAKLLAADPTIARAASHLPPSLQAAQSLVIFAVLFFLLFVLLGRYGFRTSADGRQLGALLFGLIFAWLQVGMLISIVLSFLPEATTGSLSPFVQLVFTRGHAPFIWLLMPLIFIVGLGKHVADPNEL